MPLQPAQLFAWLAHQPLHRDVCLECGAGEAEVTHFMANHFRSALALDLAPRSFKSSRFQRLQADANAIPLADQSVDLVVSVQSLHHFRLQRHIEESCRVLKSGGCFAALSWGQIVLPPAVAKAFAPVFEAIASHWEPERDWVLSGYEGLTLPGGSIKLPECRMMRTMTQDTLMEHVATWSAVQAAVLHDTELPDPEFVEDLAGDPACADPFEAHWPLVGKLFRVER